jgi:hypothetical protein
MDIEPAKSVSAVTSVDPKEVKASTGIDPNGPVSVNPNSEDAVGRLLAAVKDLDDGKAVSESALGSSSARPPLKGVA